ncbi:MAG: ATP-dependent Clp protease proteolytic subunit [Oscillospiraceae bacterium]|nr:ATP-dependent Clp protease proteolytic subunit [Oscillospiraceae bacterium]MCL2213538.1 ATP-dependent Clp protease proteolytic subunit [Oscillospiraceae bacterium]
MSDIFKNLFTRPPADCENLPEDEGNEGNEQEDSEEDCEGGGEQLESIFKTGAVITKKDNATIHTITIIGQIEGHYLLPSSQKSTKYEHMIPILMATEESEAIDGLLLLINTVGGDVEAGLAIAELIAGLTKPTVSLVLGGGHSIGVPLAVSAKKSFIAPSATMTLHPVRMNGLVIGTSQTFNYFQRMQDRIANFVTGHSNISDQRFRELMLNTEEIASDMGTIIDGEQAVQEGLIDRVGTLSDAIACLKEMIKSNTHK